MRSHLVLVRELRRDDRIAEGVRTVEGKYEVKEVSEDGETTAVAVENNKRKLYSMVLVE